MRYLVDDSDSSLHKQFDGAMERKREREDAAELPLPLDPDTGADFGRALANVDMILTAMAAGWVDPYAGAIHVAAETSRHLVDEQLACDLYLMWIELTDLFAFTEEGGQGRQDVVMVMRDAAREWLDRKEPEPEWSQDYFDRWTKMRDHAIWRDRLGGPLFNSLEASGWFGSA